MLHCHLHDITEQKIGCEDGNWMELAQVMSNCKL